MSNDKKPRVRNRDKRFTLRVTQEEKDFLLAAMAATNSKSVVELVLNSINNSGIVLVSEVEKYSTVLSKAKDLGSNIKKGIDHIQKKPEKFQTLINYLEKDDGKNLNAIVSFSANLDRAVKGYCFYEENVKRLTDLTLKDVIKAKKKKGV
ncbi:hypothetical protein ATI02_3348 [Pseudomonas baetica]|uniref:Uncharacterized protein n=1 Tax=Pseudomonas baetica TaxID=674054 RepID=A0ABX4Q0X5_9PSED|nr:hypothetical protein [Pseudomonas baetica]PKA70443.1 hypothetical protein ATI02_3348 [Pseudomonas baetica]PTC16542.1 hypothetical protein C0J26_30100 [Pseudomonas baetica]